MKTEEIACLVKATLAEHRKTRDTLAEAIAGMLEPMPNGTTLQVGQHKVEMRKVFCGCSQWANRTWDVTGKADGYLVDGQLIRNEDPDVWDGNNRHYRKTPLYLDSTGEGEALRLAPAKTLRSLAKDLPQAIAEWVARKQVDTAATAEATTALCAVKA